MSNEAEQQTPPPSPAETTPPETTPETTPSDPLLVGSKPEGETPPPKEDEPAPFVPLTGEQITELLPEGMTLEGELADKFSTFLTDNKFGAEQTAALIEMHSSLTAESAKAAELAWSESMKAWQTATREHPTIGGDKLDGVLAEVNTLVDDYADDDFRTMLAETGVGNHPALISFLHKIYGNLPQEGKPVNDGQPTGSQKSLAQRLVPSAT